MDRNSDVANNKIKFIAIGAGALVLALIAFSGLGWCAMLACGQRLASVSVGYWELLGGMSLAAFAVLFIRPLRNRFLPRQLRSDPPPPFLPPDLSMADLPAAVIPEPEAATGETRDSNWRQLYSQLSSDEREMFKAMVKKYCSDAPEERPATGPE